MLDVLPGGPGAILGLEMKMQGVGERDSGGDGKEGGSSSLGDVMCNLSRKQGRGEPAALRVPVSSRCSCLLPAGGPRLKGKGVEGPVAAMRALWCMSSRGKGECAGHQQP